MSDGPALSFVLLKEARNPDPEALISAAAALGEVLTVGDTPEDGPVSYELAGGGTLLIMLVDAPHPDAPQMMQGLASPSPEELEVMTAHYIVTVLGLTGDIRAQDVRMVRLTAAVLQSSPAIAGMLGTGAVFHKAEFFVQAADSADQFPMLVCVDITMAPDGEERMSMLTHGLVRYGREEFFVTASRTGQGAVDFVLSMAEWMLRDPDKQLPTGETVGRSAEEKVTVQRVPSPTGEGPEVVRLDLDL